MRYDASIILIDELTNESSLAEGADIYAREKESGFVRVLMLHEFRKNCFSNQLTNVIDFNITLYLQMQV